MLKLYCDKCKNDHVDWTDPYKPSSRRELWPRERLNHYYCTGCGKERGIREILSHELQREWIFRRRVGLRGGPIA